MKNSRIISHKIVLNNRGFTLIELLVVIIISTIMMTVLVVQQGKWNDSLTVTTQAYELSLMIRQAQLYSLGVREDVAGSEIDKFDIGYGIHIDSNSLDRYIFFADRNDNKRYDIGEVVGEPIYFTRGVRIRNFCGVSFCFPGGGPLRRASVLFFRPEPKAVIRLLNNGGNPVDSAPITIRLESAGGKVSSVRVESNGQVSISQ